MTRLVVAALFVAVTSTPLPAQDDPKKIAEAMQGEWKFVSFHKEAEPDTKDELEKNKVVIAGDKLTISRNKRDEPVTFTLDPKATPPAIDLKVAEDKKDFVIKGIYKLEKDTLTIAFGLDKGDRPKDFKPAKGNGVMVLEKVKK